MAENEVVTTLRLDSNTLRDDARKAKQEILRFKSDAEREKFELAVRTKFEKAEYRRAINDTVREMQRMADDTPVKIRVQAGKGGLFSTTGNARSELSGFGALLRGGGPLVAGTLAVHALSEAMEKLNEHITEGDASWSRFFDDFERGIPVFGKVMTMFDNATKAAISFQRIQEGSQLSAAGEGLQKIRDDIQRQIRREGKSAESGVGAFVAGNADEHATAGLEGADLQRERARQIAQKRQQEAAALIEQVDKQFDRSKVMDQMERLVDEQAKIEDDLNKTLADIDEKEAEQLGKLADERAAGAAKFAAQAGEAALKAEEQRDKELERSQDEYNRAKDQFFRELDREAAETAKMAEDELEDRAKRIKDAQPQTRGGGRIGAGGAEYGRSIQEAILAAPRNPQTEWAINGLDDLRARNRMEGGPLAPNRSGGLDRAAERLLKAGDKLSNLQVVGVVRR